MIKFIGVNFMSLYGLDVIVSNDGKYYLNEINGVKSGMKGFSILYGDDRVYQKVFQMLSEKYGLVTVNNGTYSFNKFKKEHPIRFKIAELISKISWLRDRFFRPNPILAYKKSESSWINEVPSSVSYVTFPFDVYDGQESTVLNVVNEVLPHPLVNSFIAESVSENKFLQYQLLYESSLSSLIVPSSLVGLGATDEKWISEKVKEYPEFVVKPILGSCGKGVRFMTSKEVYSKYGYSRGPLEDHVLLHCLFGNNKVVTSSDVYLDDLVKYNNFSFEEGVSIIQPFINSNVDGVHSVIRAIVCNGTFVDAYKRESSNKKVNLSADAVPRFFDYDSDFSKLCEHIVFVYEELIEKLSIDSFKEELYTKYLDKRGHTTEEDRESDRMGPLLSMMSKQLCRFEEEYDDYIDNLWKDI